MNLYKKRLIFYAIIAVITGLAGVVYWCSQPVPEALKELKATVTFDGTTITVSNNDTVDFLYSKLTVNGYYSIHDMNLRAGESYTFWPVEFLHVNGRNMPTRQKPYQFAIWCRLADGGNGFFSVKLE